jgi:hypothetical protein
MFSFFPPITVRIINKTIVSKELAVQKKRFRIPTHRTRRVKEAF